MSKTVRPSTNSPAVVPALRITSDGRGEKKQTDFFRLAERLRSSDDPDETIRLGHALGRMVFGV